MKATGAENRCADTDFGDVLFDLVFAVEVRNARLSVAEPTDVEDEMHACCLAASAAATPCRVSASVPPNGRRHREERGRSFEGLFKRSTVIERRRNECRPGVCERLCLA